MSPIEGVASVWAFAVLVLLAIRPTVGLAALATFYPLYLLVPRLPLPGMNAETTLVGFAMALTLMRFGLRLPPPRFSLPVVAFVLVLFAGWGIGVTSIAHKMGLGPWDLFKEVKTHAFTSLMFFMGYWWFTDWDDRRRLLEAVSFGTAIVAVSGIVDLLMPFTMSGEGGRAAGLMENPNGLACVAGAFGLVPLYLLTRDDLSRSRRWLHKGIYALCVVAVITSLSRGGWMAFIAGHTVWFFFINRRMLALGFAGLVLAATIAFPMLPTMVQDRVTQATENQGIKLQGAGPLEGSAAFRVVMYRIGLEMWLDSPLWGHGLDGVKILSPEYGAKYGILKHKSPHSLPLKFLAEAGLIGVAVLLGLFAVIVRVGYGIWRTSYDDPELGVLLLGAGFTIAFADLFHTNFLHVHVVSAYLWLLLGICARKYMMGDEYEESEELDMDAHGATVPA